MSCHFVQKNLESQPIVDDGSEAELESDKDTETEEVEQVVDSKEMEQEAPVASTVSLTTVISLFASHCLGTHQNHQHYLALTTEPLPHI